MNEPVQNIASHSNRTAMSNVRREVGAELLLVGHLPVRAGLWLTPFADAVARERGCTALLRLDGDEPAIQVLRGPRELVEGHHAASFEQAVMELGGWVDHWLVRGPEAASATEALACGAQRVTILSSGDEAAVVAAYQIIRDLSQRAADTETIVPEVGLAVVGADAQTAAEVVDRLNRTTVSFLGVEVRLAVCLSRMDAGVKSTCYLSFPGQKCPSLADAFGSIEQARAAGHSHAAEASVIGRVHAQRTVAGVSRAQDLLRDERIGDGNGSPPTVGARLADVALSPFPRRASGHPHADAHLNEARTTAATRLVPRPGPNYAPSPPSIKLRPKAATDVEAKQMRQPHEPSDHGRPVALCQHVPGLVVLPIRMPGHEHVELALDSAGQMHLLCREAHLREISIVEQWARAHREILAMACPRQAFDAAARVIAHVFTEQPVTLADLHATSLHLHVLAPVTVQGHTGWYCAPLNAVR